MTQTSLRVGILTVSDRVSRGEAEDRSGPALAALVESRLPGATVVAQATVPDEVEPIREIIRRWADEERVDLVLTTGGTGFAPRDRTPEATRPLLEREAPGLVVAMLVAGLRVTPHAMLSRPAAGVRGRTLIVNLPGSPKAACENLEAILPALPHGLALLREAPGAAQQHDIIPSSEEQ